jgi:hypothetical protein
MSYATFGSAARPLRPSALTWLVACPVKSLLDIDEIDSSGPAAQTGSLVHAGIEAFHLETDDAQKVAAAVAAMQRAAAEFPLADPAEARRYIEPYVCDPRNAGAAFAAVPADVKRRDGSTLRAGSPALEVPVKLELPPHHSDPTGEPIVMRGQIDQIRAEHGGAIVCDYKSGTKQSGWEMLHSYAYQQAAYVLAARASGFPDAKPGYIIRGYGYRVRGASLPCADGVFWAMPFDVAGCQLLMDRVRLQVALVRRGEIDFGPGAHCAYCPHGGLDSCIPAANKRLFSLPQVTP